MQRVYRYSSEDDGLIEGNVDDIDPKEWMVPPQCIPVHANVVTYDWSKMYEHTNFDVIMMDPPWWGWAVQVKNPVDP
jgi:hypothetical protein